jgi:transcription elongation factor Elf1
MLLPAMKQKFRCKKCGKETASKSGIEQENGIAFVVCQFCNAKNEIIQTGGGAGDPVQFTVIGLVD